jgi:hypothetical protein
MNDWLRVQIENGFSDLKGLQLRATIPLKDQVINDAIAQFLQRPAMPPSAGLDLGTFLAFVKQAHVRSTEGAVTIEVDISV